MNLNTVSDIDFIKIVSISTSIKDSLLKLGYKTHNSNIYLQLKNKCFNLGINVPKYKNNNVHKNLNKKCKELSEVLVENSNYNRFFLKKRLIKEGILEYKCNCCNLTEWMDRPISLQLEHKNGINNDNRIENLELLCPNCHSQTPTFAGKNIKKKKYYCECGETIHKDSKNCRKCYEFSQRKIKDRPSLNQLIRDVDDLGYVGSGKKYNVSNSCIKKWIKNYKNLDN